MYDIQETIRLLNQHTTNMVKSNQDQDKEYILYKLPSFVELRFKENSITVVQGYTRFLNAKNMGCIFKFITTHKWKIQTLDDGYVCKDQDQFTQILLTTEINRKYETPFYFDIISTRLRGYVVISKDHDNNKPIIYVIFTFIDVGLSDGRVEYCIACLLYLQELEKAFELSNDSDNQIFFVTKRLGIYFADVIVNIVINYL